MVSPVIIGEPRPNQHVAPVLLGQGRSIKEASTISTGHEDHGSLNTLDAFGAAARSQRHEIRQEVQDGFDLRRSEARPDPRLQSIAHHRPEYAQHRQPDR